MRTWTALAMAAALLVAAAAMAAPLKTETATKPLNEDGGKAKASCDPGLSAVSGGFQMPEQLTGELDVTFTKTSKRARSRGWVAGAESLGSQDGEPLKVFAYCRDVRIRTETVKRPIADDEAKSVTATCPAGTHAISGGYEGPPGIEPFSPYVAGSKRKGTRAWTVRYRAFEAGTKILAQVNCADVAAPRIATESLDLDPDSPNWVDERIIARCPSGTQAIAGGFAYDAQIGEGGPFVHVSKRTAGGDWAVEVATATETHATAYAYCEN